MRDLTFALPDIVGYTNHTTIARTAACNRSCRCLIRQRYGKVARLVFDDAPCLRDCSHCIRRERCNIDPPYMFLSKRCNCIVRGEYPYESTLGEPWKVLCTNCRSDERQFAKHWLWQIVQHQHLLQPPRDLVYRVMDIVEHFLIHRRNALDLWLRLAAARRTVAFFTEFSEKKSTRDPNYWQEKIVTAKKHLFDVEKKISRSKSAVKSWPLAPDRFCKDSPVPLLTAAVLAEALSLWLAPPSICKFTSRFFALLENEEVKGMKPGDDYWSCLMAKLLKKYDSLNICSFGPYYCAEDIDKVRALVRLLYVDWFRKETPLCHIRRIAAATGIEDRVQDGAMLLYDLSVEDRELQRFERDVRLAACVLVAYIREQAHRWTKYLSRESRVMVVDIVRVAGNPTGERCPSVQKSYGVIACAERLIECFSEIIRNKEERIKHGGDYEFTFEWCPEYRKVKNDPNRSCYFREDACDPPHEGLIASLQKVEPSLYYCRSSKDTTIQREASTWNHWSRPEYRLDDALCIDWLFAKIHLRTVKRCIALRQRFVRAKARKLNV
eukprot:TRINITY_DN14888_c0_g3_i1.p1 TRINITY_DN14888_c0_g3~~TRINITY_DN14888_c0_g3_i1.p1  ORF type:complete len:552 (+),score=53.95 TRINITY_DN14888_c0_g3_i1:65-1720(+)